MKSRLKLSWFFLMVLASLSLLPAAHAYYDPAAQRWLNRDQLRNAEWKAEHNLHNFVRNNPVLNIDSFGHYGWDPSKIPNKPDPECNGNILDTAEKLETKHRRDPGAGGFRHCYSACALRKCFGPIGSCLRKAWDAAYEDIEDPHSAADMRAEDVGEGIGKNGQSCEEGCLAAFPRGNEGYP